MTMRCGLVAVVGAPNAGKSTLVNALVGQKVAIVSSKAQTTRTRLMGIVLHGEAQLLLVDTPGIFEPRRRLDPRDGAGGVGRRAGADGHRAGGRQQRPGLVPRSRPSSQALRSGPNPKLLILNKVDIATKEKLLVHASRLTELPAIRGGADGIRRDRRPAWTTSRTNSPAACPKVRGIFRGPGVGRDRARHGGGGDARAALSAAPRRAALCQRG
jgi:hypothetical protein